MMRNMNRSATLAADPRNTAARPGSGSFRSVKRGVTVLVALCALALMPLGAQAQSQPDEPYTEEVVVSSDEYYAETDPSALSEFRAELTPYGTWVNDPRYGTVWIPHVVVVGEQFAPYRTAGRWAVTDAGDWMWVSDYEWGYIPFHYGRWVWIPARGWAWVPGRRYAPAWVVWRVGAPGYAYVGWAPMPPSYVWMDGVAVAVGFGLFMPFWFLPSAYLFHPYWHSHIIWDPYRVRTIAGHTHIYGGHGYARPGRGGGHRPARPSGGSGSHGGASPNGGQGSGPGDYIEKRKSLQPASPSFQEAQIPPHAVPQKRASVDSKAMALAKDPKAKARSSSSPRSTTATRAHRAGAGPATRAPRGVSRSPRGLTLPTRSADRTRPARSVSRSRSSVYPRSRPSTPSRAHSSRSRSSSRSYAPPRSRSTRHGSSGRYTAPSRSSGRYAAPSRSSGRYSAPSTRSRPSAHSRSRSSRPSTSRPSSYRAPSRSVSQDSMALCPSS